jgi:hypothetical protein
VVEGKSVADPKFTVPIRSEFIWSEEDNLLVFDENGGEKEAPISDARAVLTDELIRTNQRNAGDDSLIVLISMTI